MGVDSIKVLEAKMQLQGFNFGVKMILILVIPLLGFLCRHFTTPDLPLAFSVMWAPAGVSLSFILLFGYRVWPAIFVGNLIYNIWSLEAAERVEGIVLVDSLTISLGSLFQALLAGFIIRKLSTKTYFYSVRDIFIFLLPAGVISCLIASSFATFVIYFNVNDVSTFEEMIRTWTTFWLGDTIGVFIFTPLIVVLTIQKFPYRLLNMFWEPILMVLSILVVCWLSFVQAYPLPHLLIPLCLWITYRFRMHGAVISTLVVSLAAILPATLGHGVFVTFLSQDPLLYLVSFLGIIIGSNLFVAALVNERAEAWEKLESYSGGLQQHLETKTTELWEAHEEIYFKEKLASIGMMMSGIGRELKKPLGQLKTHLNSLFTGLTYFDNVFSEEKPKINPEITVALESNLEMMRKNIDSLKTDHEKILKIVNMIVKESDLSEIKAPKVKSINLHTLLNRCLSQTLSDSKAEYPHLHVVVTKDYDQRIEMIEGVAEDLTHAFVNLLDNALSSLAEKSMSSHGDFSPKLEVKTIYKPKSAVVTIWDNGGGVTEAKKANYFEPFLTEDGELGGGGLGLAMTHDIIVQEHHGSISIESDGIDSQQINIELPKNIHKNI